MSPASTVGRFKRHAVPVVLSVVVVTVVLVVPPVVLGGVTGSTYPLTAAILLLAAGSVFPYAVLVGVGTLPLLHAGVASFGAPQTAADVPHSLSAGSALRHVFAGVAYVLGAAAVGAVGIGAQIAGESDSTALPAALQPSFLYLGGVIVAGVFVCLQTWRYDASVTELPGRIVLGTMALGALLALSPAVAFWAFEGV